MPKRIDAEVIFRATIKIFSEKGYGGTTTKDVASEAGVNEATLYRKYGNKEGLLERAVNWQMSEVPFGKTGYSGNIRKDLDDILQAYEETSKICGYLIPVLFIESRRHPELKGTLAGIVSNISGIRGIFSRHQEARHLKRIDTDIMASAFLGLLFMKNIIPDSLDSTSASSRSEIIDNFLHGYGEATEDSHPTTHTNR